jgi:hypothetical protein
MRRGFRWALIALPWLGLLAMGYHTLSQSMSGWWDLSSDAHMAARNAFFADLAYEGCVRPEAVIAAAEARGWYRGPQQDFPWCIRPAGLSGWLHVDISPPLPFSSEGENAAYIGFDAQGCMATWTYANGPGTTCPDR